MAEPHARDRSFAPISSAAPQVSGHGHDHGQSRHDHGTRARLDRAASPFARTSAQRLGKVALALAGLWTAVGWALGWWSS